MHEGRGSNHKTILIMNYVIKHDLITVYTYIHNYTVNKIYQSSYNGQWFSQNDLIALNYWEQIKLCSKSKKHNSTVFIHESSSNMPTNFVNAN